MKGFTSRAIHSKTQKKDIHGSLRMPVYDSVAFEIDSSKNMELSFHGQRPAHLYSRASNPTVEEFEQKIVSLFDAKGVLALSSGMAAIANTIFAICSKDTNIITTKYLFGNTLSLFEKTFGAWGLQVRYIEDSFSNNKIQSLIDENTRAIFIESISNPNLNIFSIEKLASISNKNNIPLILDGTLTTPYIFPSKDFGVNIEILSSTKYISGGATGIGGLILDYGNFNWEGFPPTKDLAKKFGPFSFMYKLRSEVYRNLGSCMSPHNAYMHTLGLETLALRINRSCENAQNIAEFLCQQSKVYKTSYPGLSSYKYHSLAKKFFKNAYGGILTFELSSKEDCFKFMDSLEMIKRATNLNDNKSLVLHPASTIFAEYTDKEKNEMKLSDKLIRLSCGIEDIKDILEDIKQGLEKI